MQLHRGPIDFNVDRTVVGKILNTWINFMYYELGEFDWWLPRKVIDEHFPKGFKNMFPTTRLTLDATEVPIQRPQNCDAQRMTFSTYTHRNTAKPMIGVTPRGIISYLSSSYGGSVSDRQITERSSLVRNTSLFDRQDSILADRGIMVQDLFSSMNVLVNNPTSMKGKNQLDPETVIKDRRIASKRIHIERVIGYRYAKTFKILQHLFQRTSS